jgi:hypothetical protein
MTAMKINTNTESTVIQCLEGAYHVRHLRNITVTYRRKTFKPSYRRSGGGCGRRRRTRGPDLQNKDMGTHYMKKPRSICQRAKYSPCPTHYIHTLSLLEGVFASPRQGATSPQQQQGYVAAETVTNKEKETRHSLTTFATAACLYTRWNKSTE